MYYEVWVDELRRKEIEIILRNICSEVHEVLYDYQYIVDISDENLLEIDGIKMFRKHYDC